MARMKTRLRVLNKKITYFIDYFYLWSSSLVIALLTITLNTNANPYINDPKDTLRTWFKAVDAKTLVKVIVIINPARTYISIKILNVS